MEEFLKSEKKSSASISMHAFGAEISATVNMLYIAPSQLVSTFHFPSCLFPTCGIFGSIMSFLHLSSWESLTKMFSSQLTVLL